MRICGTPPAAMAHWSTGYGTPSACTKRTPSTSGSVIAGAEIRRRESAPVKASSAPIEATQAARVPTMATIQAATKAAQNVASMSGVTRIAR